MAQTQWIVFCVMCFAPATIFFLGAGIMFIYKNLSASRSKP
jgi:hypothetical protein